MLRILATIVLAVAAMAASQAIAAEQDAGATTEQAVTRKLYDLGYPADRHIAIQRWRADTDRRGSGPLSEEETAALLAHPMPEFFAALTGNPFTGMGVAIRHKTRAEAERDALQICRRQGGGANCVAPMVTRSEHCVVIVGYNVTIDRRPTYRTSVAVSPSIELSHDRAMEGCQTGATHPKLCRPLISYCGDGRSLQTYDGEPSAEAAARTDR